MLNSGELGAGLPSSFLKQGAQMTDNSSNPVSDNLETLAGKSSNRRRSISLFAGWSFIRFCEGNDNSFPVMPRYDLNAPTLEFNPDCVGLDHLENPSFAPFWLPLALSKICYVVLNNCIADTENRVGNLEGPGWDAFRAEIVKHCQISIEGLVASGSKDDPRAFDETVAMMTQGLYYDSGLHESIIARQSGRVHLRSA
jgi:hypothetical protein